MVYLFFTSFLFASLQTPNFDGSVTLSLSLIADQTDCIVPKMKIWREANVFAPFPPGVNKLVCGEKLYQTKRPAPESDRCHQTCQHKKCHCLNHSGCHPVQCVYQITCWIISYLVFLLNNLYKTCRDCAFTFHSASTVTAAARDTPAR